MRKMVGLPKYDLMTNDNTLESGGSANPVRMLVMLRCLFRLDI